jgi:site-specific recombinase XerC
MPPSCATRLKGFGGRSGPHAQKAPALTDNIRAMVDAADAGNRGVRDRALVLLGFAGAFRTSELVGLNVEDCAFFQRLPHGDIAEV